MKIIIICFVVFGFLLIITAIGLLLYLVIDNFRDGSISSTPKERGQKFLW
jgi:hypothetical protein